MSISLRFLIGGLSAATLSFAAAAQPGPAMQGMGASGATAKPAAVHCAKARDPQRCEALQKAKETCKDKIGADKRKCMSDAMPPMDCSKARNPARCEAHQKAKEACKDKPAAEHRQCLRDQLRRGKPAAEPAKPKN